MRVRHATIAVLVVLLCGAVTGIAAGQDPTGPAGSTDTSTLGDYQSTLPTVPTETTGGTSGTTPTTSPEQAVEGVSTTQNAPSGQTGSSPGSSAAATPQGSTPDRLAFTGARSLLLLLLGAALAGSAGFLLWRPRRR